jgi:FAD:protein FMN transferase
MTAVLPETARYVEHVMGMPISLALRGRHTDDAAARVAWAEVMLWLHEVDRVFSTYRPCSAISRLNRGEVELEDCPPEVAEVLALGDLARLSSGGAFDVRRPGPDGGTVLDPSGVVKGWAVERVAGVLADLADTDYCLSAGGDMTCRTVDPDGRPWRIGVEDPADPRRILVDARTGRPPVGVASVTVIAGSLTWADIDATAAYAQGRDAARWLETRPGRSGLVVWDDGTTTTVEPVL